MRIGIDARFFGSIGKGLGRYTQKLIENLEKIYPEGGEIVFFVILRKKNWNEYHPKNRNFQKILADIPWYGFREQLFFPKILEKLRLDLVHFPHFNVPLFFRGKFIVTIHDLILLHYPTKRASALSPLGYFFKKKAYGFVIKHAVKKSQKIIAVSKYTKSDIEKYFGIPEEKIIVTYEGVDIAQKALKKTSEEILKKYGIMKPYILYVGNTYPHKNLERLVLVFRELAKKHPHLHLVLVGKEDYFSRRLKKFTRENWVKQVVFTDFVTDDELGVVYKEARLYVFPSLYEGFGLPPLEAMARDVPVVSSNASCLPEILGESAYYFDPRGMSAMAEAIEKVATDGELREKIISFGRQQIKKYSWEKMARETLEVYQSALQNRSEERKNKK